MKSISRFFNPKKAPASSKSPAGKEKVLKASVNKEGTGNSPSAFDSMDDAPRKEKSITSHMPPSAFKKGKSVAMHDNLQPATTGGKRTSKDEANNTFNRHYGDAKTAAQSAPRQAKYTFNTDPVKEVFVFEKDVALDSHIRGDVAKLHEIALKRNEPVFFITEQGRTLVWPSGHMYTGAFEREGLKPGPLGKLTLPSGQEVKAYFNDGKCYRAEDSEGKSIDPGVKRVHGFYTPSRI